MAEQFGGEVGEAFRRDRNAGPGRSDGSDDPSAGIQDGRGESHADRKNFMIVEPECQARRRERTPRIFSSLHVSYIIPWFIILQTGEGFKGEKNGRLRKEIRSMK